MSVQLAARASKPYDDYIDKVLDGIDFRDIMGRADLRYLLADAWMEGLKYSLVMVESEKRKRDGIL